MVNIKKYDKTKNRWVEPQMESYQKRKHETAGFKILVANKDKLKEELVKLEEELMILYNSIAASCPHLIKYQFMEEMHQENEFGTGFLPIKYRYKCSRCDSILGEFVEK
jgi:hypothetical protein